jgi:hypothetical protein
MAQNTAFPAYFASRVMASVDRLRVGQAKLRLDSFDCQASRSSLLDSITDAPPPPSLQQGRIVGEMLAGTSERLHSLLGRRKNVPQPRPQSQTGEDILLDLASRMDSDGGMPGPDLAARAIATVVALMAFVSQGHTPSTGAFRSHVSRLVKFLQSLKSLSAAQQQLVNDIVAKAEKGTAPAGDWLRLSRTPGDHWKAVTILSH